MSASLTFMGVAQGWVLSTTSTCLLQPGKACLKAWRMHSPAGLSCIRAQKEEVPGVKKVNTPPELWSFKNYDVDISDFELPPKKPPRLLIDEDVIALEDKATGWCSLCGGRSGWMQCGRCQGKGGYATDPGLAGVKDMVGWARCKVCFGRKVVPCFLCGITNIGKWEVWQEYAYRHPRKKDKDMFKKGPEGRPRDV